MELTKLAETTDTITLGWEPEVDGRGYLLWREKSPTVPIPSGGTRPAFTQVYDPLRDRAVFSKDSAWYRVDAIDVISEGVYPGVVQPPPPPPPPPPPSGDNIVRVNQTWNPPESNWGHKDLVDVRITDTDPRRDNVHLAGSGTIDRFYGTTRSGDMFKVHTPVNGIVVGRYDQQSEFYSLAFSGSVHQDGIQAMGGKSCKFVGFYMQKDINGNSHFFCNMGAGGQSRPTDITVEFSVINGYRGTPGHGGGRPVRISDSVRCGIKHCLVIYATDPGIPLMVAANATDPVVEDSFSMTHADWDSIGGNTLGPRHRDLWNANGTRKAALIDLINSGKAKLLEA